MRRLLWSISVPYFLLWCFGGGNRAQGFGSAPARMKTDTTTTTSIRTKTTDGIAVADENGGVSRAESSLFTPIVWNDDLPEALGYPHNYEPHDVAKQAALELQKQLPLSPRIGKMLGVLVCQDDKGRLGYLKAFSGQEYDNIALPNWCPPVLDYLQPDGFYKQGETDLEELTKKIKAMKEDPDRQQRLQQLQQQIKLAQDSLDTAKREQKEAKEQRKETKKMATSEIEQERLRQESAYYQRRVKKRKTELLQLQETQNVIDREISDLKQRRSGLSASLTKRIFESYQFQNARGEAANLLNLFADTPLKYPPGGAGDCAGIKLFQTAFVNGYRPVALAEFWWGPPPSGAMFRHGHFYPCCRGKCQPILQHMLLGLKVEGDPLEAASTSNEDRIFIDIVFEDECLLIVNKPADVLSVPGRNVQASIQTEITRQYPSAMMCHRLDLSTSGLLVIAKNKSVHKHISQQFISREIKKRYECLLDGQLPANSPQKGTIDLPITPDYINRPMQTVDFEKGKPSVTHFEILGEEPSAGNGKTATRAYLYPVTGRTHQLRVHAAHPQGLNLPMVGDDIYGKRSQRLCLHAGFLELTHPVSNKKMQFQVDAPF